MQKHMQQKHSNPRYFLSSFWHGFRWDGWQKSKTEKVNWTTKSKTVVFFAVCLEAFDSSANRIVAMNTLPYVDACSLTDDFSYTRAVVQEVHGIPVRMPETSRFRRVMRTKENVNIRAKCLIFRFRWMSKIACKHAKDLCHRNST